MPVYHLWRAANDSQDSVTRALVAMDDLDQLMKSSLLQGVQRFWDMRRAGELLPNEALAPWLVLMREVDASTAVRAVLIHCVDYKPILASQKPYTTSGMQTRINESYLRLAGFIADKKDRCNGTLSAPTVQKLRHGLVERLRAAAAIHTSPWPVLDPRDASLLLQACEVALEAPRNA